MHLTSGNLRQSPPHDKSREDPKQNGEAGEIHRERPELVQEEWLIVAVASVHAHDDLIPAALLPFRAQLLVLDDVSEPQLVEEGIAIDGDFIRAVHGRRTEFRA